MKHLIRAGNLEWLQTSFAGAKNNPQCLHKFHWRVLNSSAVSGESAHWPAENVVVDFLRVFETHYVSFVLHKYLYAYAYLVHITKKCVLALTLLCWLFLYPTTTQAAL